GRRASRPLRAARPPRPRPASPAPGRSPYAAILSKSTPRRVGRSRYRGAERKATLRRESMTTQMQTAVGRFVWHDLNTTDDDAAKRFYVELLGWDVEVWKPGEMDYPMISAKGSQHGGF